MSNRPIDRTLSDATTPGQSGPGSDGNEGVLHIPQSSNIAGTSPSDCLVSLSGHSLGGGLTPLQRSSQCILQPWPTGLPRWKEEDKDVSPNKLPSLRKTEYLRLVVWHCIKKKKKKKNLVTGFNSLMHDWEWGVKKTNLSWSKAKLLLITIILINKIHSNYGYCRILFYKYFTRVLVSIGWTLTVFRLKPFKP